MHLSCSGIRQEQNITNINFWAPEVVRCGGGLPGEGVGVEKLVPSLETQGEQTSASGCPRNFARMSRTPWECSKTLYENILCSLVVRIIRKRHKNTRELRGQGISRDHQWTAKGAGGKVGQKRQKSSKASKTESSTLSTVFAQGKTCQKSSTSVQIDVRRFSTPFAWHQLSGPF